MGKQLQKTSSGNGHPYRKLSFWRENPFWETGMYSEASKQYFRDWVTSMIKDEKRSYLMNKKAA
jgi:hypothetical protein